MKKVRKSSHWGTEDVNVRLPSFALSVEEKVENTGTEPKESVTTSEALDPE